MKSLQARLALWLGLSLILIFGGIALITSQFPRYLTEEYVLTRLEHDGDSLKNRLVLKAGKPPALSPGPIAPIYETKGSGHYYQVSSADGAIYSTSLDDFKLQVSSLAPGKTRTSYASGPENQTLLLWSMAAESNGVNYSLAVAEDISHMESHLAKFQWQYIVAVLVTLLLLLSAQAFVIRLSLRPLEQARQQLMEMVAGNREKITATVPSEINPLVGEVNRLGEATRRNIEKSRNALGNLAHALKTPLAVIKQTIESDVTDQRQAFSTLQHQSEKIQQTIENELKRSRISGTALPGQCFDLDEEIPPLIKVLEQVYHNKALNIETVMPPKVQYRVDRADMHEMFGNLLDNACKWADKRIRLTVQTTDQLAFSVEDDGPGIANDQIDALTTRGKRLDESIPGHGLGLSIVCEIVESYGGTISFSRSDLLKGLKVEVRLGHPS